MSFKIKFILEFFALLNFLFAFPEPIIFIQEHKLENNSDNPLQTFNNGGGTFDVEKDTVVDSAKAKEEREIQKIDNLNLRKRLSYGIGYCGGLHYVGKDIGPPEDWLVLPFDWLYWLNSIEGSVTYLLNKVIVVGVRTGYMWASLGKRGVGGNWEIQIIPITFDMMFKGELFSLKISSSYYFSDCRDIEKVYVTDPDEPWKHYFVGYKIINGKGNGIGYSFSIDKKWFLTSFGTVYISFSFRKGWIRYNSTSPVTYFPITLDMTGIFIHIYIKPQEKVKIK